MLRRGPLLLLLLAGCRDEPPVVDGRPPDVVVREVLERCHGMLQGADKMARSLVELRRDADGEPETVLLGADSRMRRTCPDGTIDVRLPEAGFHVTAAGAVEPLAGEALARLDRFQALVRAALLAPLYGAARTVRRGEMVELIQSNGAMWNLRLAAVEYEGKPIALPQWLSGPPGEVTFVAHLHTGPTHLPKRVELGEFGRYDFALRSSGVDWDDAAFTDPRSAEPKKRVDVDYASRPPWDTPEVQKLAARRCLVFPDPGTWEGRIAAIEQKRLELVAQGQTSADLDFLFDREGVRYVAMPFGIRSDDKARPFVATAQQQVLRLPAHTAVVLYPKRGSLAACEAAATEQLRAFVAANHLQVTGPLRIFPHVAWEKAFAPGQVVEDLDRLVVRFELPVREP